MKITEPVGGWALSATCTTARNVTGSPYVMVAGVASNDTLAGVVVRAGAVAPLDVM
jgi:hypothetical protein